MLYGCFEKVSNIDLMIVILAERALAAFKVLEDIKRVVVLVVSNIDGHLGYAVDEQGRIYKAIVHIKRNVGDVVIGAFVVHLHNARNFRAAAICAVLEPEPRRRV